MIDIEPLQADEPLVDRRRSNNVICEKLSQRGCHGLMSSLAYTSAMERARITYLSTIRHCVLIASLNHALLGNWVSHLPMTGHAQSRR